MARAAVVVITVFWTFPAAAQDQLVLQFYHGKNGESGPVTYEMNDGVKPTLKPRLNRPMVEGSEVCVRIVNSHPVLYDYRLAVAVDTTPPPAPQGMSAFLSPLNSVFGAHGSALDGTGSLTAASFLPEAETESARAIMSDAQKDESAYMKEIDNLRLLLDSLAADIKTAQGAVGFSDQPEPLTYNFGGVATTAPLPDGRAGFAYAQREMRALKGEVGRFNDNKLMETLRGEQTRLNAVLKDAPEGFKHYARLLSDRGATLLQLRNALRDTYINAKPLGMLCETVTRGRNTITLRVTRRDALLVPARDTGPALLTATVATFYPRPLLELVPVAYGIYSTRVPEFAIQDSVVRRDEGDAYRFRAGSMLIINPLMFGPDRSIALGGGLGVGISGQGTVISDLMIGALLSYRDYFRVGLGFGWAELPRSLKAPARENAPLPADVGELDELVQTKKKGAVFAIFQLAGISLPILKR